MCKFVVHQISKVLPNDPQGRHDFVASGGLAAVQALDALRLRALKEYVDVIKSCYPEEIVRYYSPTYGTELLEKLEVTVDARWRRAPRRARRSSAFLLNELLELAPANEKKRFPLLDESRERTTSRAAPDLRA